MKKRVSLLLSILCAISFLPCLAMEKEKKPLTKADSALLKAAHDNDCLKVAEALKNGANVNSTDIDENSPLHYAIQNGNYELFETLNNKTLIPFILNKYSHCPLFYLDSRFPFIQQWRIVYTTIKKSIVIDVLDQFKNKKIDKEKINEITSIDSLIACFKEAPDKKETHFHCLLFENFFYVTCAYILLALDDRREKMISKMYTIDPLLPYSDISSIQKKASHLLQTLKIIITAAHEIVKKPLTTQRNGMPFTKDKQMQKSFDFFNNFKCIPETSLAGAYGLQLKSIIEHQESYVAEIKLKRDFAIKQEGYRKYISHLIPLVIKEQARYLPNTVHDRYRMEYIVANAPKSDIKPQQFALAFTTFARLRRGLIKDIN